MDDPRTQIERLEVEIEQLSSAAERGRKIDLAARITMAAGGLWLSVGLIGIVPGQGAATVIAISAVLFGIVLYGSNRSTCQQVSGRLASLRAQRMSLIDELDLRLVRDTTASDQTIR